MRPVLHCALLSTLVLSAACQVDYGVRDGDSPEIAAAKAELREYERTRDFEVGLRAARDYVAQAPHDDELRALYTRHLGAWRNWKEAHAQADTVLADDPDSPWGLYARAWATLAQLDDWGDAEEVSRRAWEALPRPEFAATHVAAVRYASAERALAFLDGLDSTTANAPEVLRIRAEVEHQAQYQLDDPTWADSSFATLARLRERWPEHVDGYLLAAENLFRANRADEALPLIEEAVRLAPSSVEVRQWHWWILWESDVLPEEERRSAVDASIAAFTEAAPETVRGLSAMAAMYRDMDDLERARELEGRVLILAPTSRHATQIHAREYNAATRELNRLYREEGSDSEAYRAQLAVVSDAVNGFLERPLYDDRYRAPAYISLYFALAAMDPVPADKLLAAVRGLAEHERLNPHITFSAAPISLADHTPYALEAAEVARSGLEPALERAELTRSSYKTEGEYEQSQLYYLSLIYDAMGWGYFKAGRIDDGQHQIERALALSEGNREASYHLGQLFEHRATLAEEADDPLAARGHLDRAEDAYIAGLGSTRVGENPSQAAIEALYERRNGSRAGIDEYLATLGERDALRRKEQILEDRLEAVGGYEPFSLARLDGEEVDSDALEGKIGVVHFWGTWCGPCIVEMPEYQKFAARYRDDPDVMVVSISNDNSRDVVEEYMTRNRFDFSVLMDDGYVQRAGVSAWPTTWFVDRDGYVRFVKQGNTSKLDEEFAWRVEALREEGGR